MEDVSLRCTPLEPMPDDMLLAGLGAGEPRAARAFIRRFQPAVFGVALAIVRDSGLAEDIAQQAFERAWRHAGLYDPRRGSVRTWLTRMVHNLAVDTMRVQRPTPVNPQDLAPLISAITDTPEHRALAGETSTQLQTALATLPPEQARTVVMAAMHGMTAQQIANTENIPVSTAKSRIRAAITNCTPPYPPREPTMRELTCHQCHEIAAELALDTISGIERTQALAHLDNCTTCRDTVSALTLTVDRLIELIPETQPPPGFEHRVMTALTSPAPCIPRW
jgi:RNA polymerase sigma factor (sigma-70 family)